MSAKKQTRNRTPHKPRSDFQRLARRFMSGLLRSLFFINKPSKLSKAGFVLPTTVLLLLMVSLTVGAMSYRTFSRTSQTIAYRDQQVIDGLAAPAIDRAKAKIEYLLTKDPSVADKRPPSSGDLLNALAANPATYTIPGNPGEIQEDINEDGTPDNAWSFIAPDGTKIIYSLTIDDSKDGVSIDSDVSDQEKAEKFVVRNGPIDTAAPSSSCPVERLAGDGWQLTGARLAKNFQVDVLAIKGSGPNRTVSASEYQQVRTASRGNRWGAWFRYDLAIAPGGVFRWNGAMHTEGNLLAAGAKKQNKGRLIAYMLSSAKSCVYDDDASVIEVSGSVDNDDDGTPEFQGQLVSGVVSESGSDSSVDRAIFHSDKTATDPDTSDNNNPYKNGIQKLSAGENKYPRDTIKLENNGSAADVMQDPIQIFTEDKFFHLSDPAGAAGTRKWIRDDTGGVTRVENDDSGAARPFLDDGFRADNRYGPKPVYNSKNSFSEINGIKFSDMSPPKVPHKSGENIDDNNLLTKDNSETQDYGLDGYWERSAAAQGLRLIVGQRLELGNMFGWGGNDDPLYPPASASFEEMKSEDSTPKVLKGAAETLQMRSLRDNLAAVQSMAAYHSLDTVGGKFPLACLASTVHPGTQFTLENSRTFDKYSYIDSIGATQIGWKTDFLTGNGTNGIEFSTPTKGQLGVVTTTVDGENVETMTTGAMDTDWFNALNNLAYFAGDPQGGAPSFPASQLQSDTGVVVHPYPYLSMWGDFSILRRILSSYGSNDALSTADQSTVHTAACTLGMLAYNLESVNREAKFILGDHLSSIVSAIDTNLVAINGKDTVKEKLKFISDSTAPAAPILTDDEIAVIDLYRQIKRDRKVGFLSDSALTTDVCSSSDFDDVPGISSDTQKDSLSSAFCVATTLDISKYPSLYYLFPAVASHTQTGTGEHAQPAGEEFFSEGIDAVNAANRYISSASVNASVSYVKVNDLSTKIALVPRAPSEPEWRMPARSLVSNSDFDFSGPVTAPKVAFDDSAKDNPGDVVKNLSQNIVGFEGNSGYDFYQTAVLDKAMMDGRELMSVRVTDLDIDLLTNVDTSVSGDTDSDIKVGGKAWIREDSGIVYAFREDAVREDSIVRPYANALGNNATTAWEACNTVANITDAAQNCHMVVDPAGPYDPPLNSTTGISPKPVDMVADPLRRPYGFRLINGKSLNRPDVAGTVLSAGMTFVTDNSVYIKGDFNLHAQKNALDLELALIEEFKNENPGDDNLLGTKFAKFGSSDNDEKQARKLFYGRDTLDDRFARPNEDNWRPVEIFADAATMLSDIHLDGWIEDYFVTSMPDPLGDGGRGKPTKNSSYLNSHRPFFKPNIMGRYQTDKWKHESADATSATPILVDRDGKTYRDDTTGTYKLFPKESGGRNVSFYVKNDQNLYVVMQSQQPTPQKTTDATPKAPVRINALLIAGITPAREGQGYGGLHNFPRLLEFWPGRQLVISGGFFQLNFSSQAVGPFDQDAWEPGVAASAGNQQFIQVGGKSSGNQKSSNFFYGAAERIWGYDVGFQYTPAGPIARRFVRLDRPRSEFYRELPVDDPYIQMLCTASGGSC